MQDPLNLPHGGQLVCLFATPERILELEAESRGWPSWGLDSRQRRDRQLLTTGGVSRLHNLMSRADCENTSQRTSRLPEAVRESR
jgi:ATP sulfurylase